MNYDIFGFGLKTGFGIEGLADGGVVVGLALDSIAFSGEGDGDRSGTDLSGYFLRIGLMRFSF